MTAQTPDEIKTGSVSGESQYVRRTDEQIKELALAVIRGEVFGSWNVREHDMHLLGNIFMPVILMEDIALKELRRDGITHFYAFMRDAGPRAINGYPCFFSMHVLNADDAKRLGEKVIKIQEALDSV